MSVTWHEVCFLQQQAAFEPAGTNLVLLMCTGMHDVDQRLTKDVDRLCSDLADLIPTMVGDCTWCKNWQHGLNHGLPVPVASYTRWQHGISRN